MQPFNETIRKTKVIIIGAGPSGILALKHLKNESNVEVISFESKPSIGGMWLYTNINEENHPDLQKDAFYKYYGTLQSSLYEDLRVDIPKILMTFKGFPMNPSITDFPTSAQFHQYLQEYVDHFKLQENISFNTFVVKTQLTQNLNEEELQKFYLIFANQHNGDKSEQEIMQNHQQFQSAIKNFKFIVITTTSFEPDVDSHKKVWFADYIICANGHYSIPYTPIFEGVGEWDGIQFHSHYYRKEKLELFANKRIALLGGRASAMDLLNFSLKMQNPPTKILYIGDEFFVGKLQNSEDLNESHKRGQFFTSSKKIFRLKKGKIIEFEDNSEEEIDVLVYCTGYKYGFPFIQPKDNIIECYNQEKRQNAWGPLHLNLFSINEPNFITIGLAMAILGIQSYFERQAIVCARVITGKIKLPSRDQIMQVFNEKLQILKGIRPDLSNQFRANFMIPQLSEAQIIADLKQLAQMEVDQEFEQKVGQVVGEFIKFMMKGNIISWKGQKMNHIYGNDYAPASDKF